MKKKNIFFLLLLIILGGIIYYFKAEFSRGSKIGDLTIDYNTTQKQSDYYEINVETINGDALGSMAVNSFIEQEVSEFKLMANTQVPELREIGFSGKYTLDIIIEDHQTDNYISYVLKRGEYTGGANANQITKSFVFNKKNQKEVNLSEIVNESFFTKTLKEKLKKMENNGNTFPGVSEQISLQDINSFYINKEEIGVLFSEYKVAPGVAGIVEIKLDKEKIIN